MTLDQDLKELFDQRPDLDQVRGRFHSHITIARDGDPAALRAFCRPRPMKLTVIDLADNAGARQQRDVMTTQYHVDPREGAVRRIAARLAVLTEELKAAGFEVLRLKLEHEIGPGLKQLDADRYRETHIKLRIPAARFEQDRARLGALGDELGFVPSRNPYERDAEAVSQFVNLRAYSGAAEEADRIADQVAERLAREGFEVVAVKRETAVLDSRRDLDGWWL